MEEIRKAIDGYDNYEVSNKWRVRKIIILKQTPNNKWYLRVWIWPKVARKKKRVHRLVAEAFLSNEKNLPEVNHIDEDKTNNNVDNLEWCTHIYNIRYSKAAHLKWCRNRVISANHGQRKNRAVIRTNKKWENECRYKSLNEAAKKNWISYTGWISSCCRWKLKTAHWYIWRYA